MYLLKEFLLEAPKFNITCFVLENSNFARFFRHKMQGDLEWVLFEWHTTDEKGT